MKNLEVEIKKENNPQIKAIENARHTYSMPYWSSGYFDINDQGHVCVKPDRDSDFSVDLYQLALSFSARGLTFPVLVRFMDILKDRVEALHQAFAQACENNHYQGAYRPVYPIKVNQQKSVIEAVLSAGKVGLEAGSKAELLAILGLPVKHTVICNGYKDQAYVRYALIGLQMGLEVYLVIEKPSELDIIIAQAQRMQIQPCLGIRIRLSSISAGKWQNSGGEKSKFGLHVGEVLALVEKLRQHDMLGALRLLHFHIGSQVANIHDIKTALQEAVRFYAELHHVGVLIKIVDVGGGLAVDYDGSQSRHACSMNYSLEEYAENIIACFARFCNQQHLPHPDIITESGRAMAAHHAVLVTHVIDVERVASNFSSCPSLKQNILESYHDAVFELTDARAMFMQNQLNLAQLAGAEKQFINVCQHIREQLDQRIQTHRELLQELDEILADKVFCNFSLFQSMPDVWGIKQIFPIMPIHRLNEPLARRAIVQDLTCDSDGRIDCYIDRQNKTKTLAIHDIDAHTPYYIGFFLLGAYQEILGDMHNLFGDTDTLNITRDKNGYHIAELVKGEQVAEVLDYVHINPEQLKQDYRQKLQDAELSELLQKQFAQELAEGLMAYTYLEK